MANTLGTEALIQKIDWRKCQMVAAIRAEKHRDALEHAAELAHLLRLMQYKQRSKMRRKS